MSGLSVQFGSQPYVFISRSRKGGKSASRYAGQTEERGSDHAVKSVTACDPEKKPAPRRKPFGIIAACIALAAVVVCGEVFLPKIIPGKDPVKVGDHIYFGSYPQSAAPGTDAYEPEPVEWRVLEVQDGKALLISEYLLDCKQYNETDESVTWETCTLRKWLNDDFYRAAFTDSEKDRIQTVKNKNPDNLTYGTSGGRDTEDKVFCLCFEESQKYFGGDNDRKAIVTAYAGSRGAHVNDTYGTGWWWLRSPGYESDLAAVTDTFGHAHGSQGLEVNDKNDCVRPVILVSLPD